jgi:hypothetical protein
MRPKTKKTRTTKNRAGAPALLARSALVCAAALLAGVSLSSGQPNDKKSTQKPAAYAIIAGTVFRDPGFAQQGAALTLMRKDDPKGKKLQAAVSDSRGEFAFRVPPGKATYVIHATLKGYRPVQQDIEIEGEEQVNATLLLVAESK